MIEATLEQIRADDYDWVEVFRYANGETTAQGVKEKPECVPGAQCHSDHFGMSDVAELLGSAVGENDGAQWVAYGRLNDGRFFAVRAGCDYTGWD